MVEDIESFGTKLETYALIALGQSELFEERYVHVGSAWLAHAGNGAWSIAEGEWGDGSSVLQYADIIASGGVKGGI
jgi:predicted NUDIX family NTP pyrophosphohydrolase